MTVKLRQYLLGALLLCSSLLFSQPGANVWYFGQNAGLDFNATPPTIIPGITGVDGSAGLMEMASTITDGDGNFLFAVNGNDIYSADLVRRGGTHSTDNVGETSQGAMIIPVPGTTNEYYVTTVPYGSGPCNSGSPGYVKVTVNGTTGNNITVGPPQTLPTNNVAHGQMIIPKTDPITGEVLDEFWLYHHGRNSNEFHRYSIEAGGIVFDQTITGGPSFTQNCGNPGADVINFMKSNGCYNQFVIGNGDNVYLFDIDASTGDITYQNSAGPITQAYGVEFSASGKNVFISTGTTGGQSARPIYKIPVSPGGLPGSSLGTATQIGTMNVTRGGGMQMAPDGKIYIGGMADWSGTPKTSYLGTITDPDGAATFNGQGVAIPNSLVGMGVPAIPASLVSNRAQIQFQAGCAGDQVDFSYIFSGTEQTPPERLWQFFDTPTATGVPASTSTNQSASHTWASTGTYAVTLQVKDVCGRTKYDTAQVVIGELVVTTEPVDSVCPGETANFSSTDANAASYKWFDAANGGTELATGAAYSTTLVQDSVCVWVEPDGVIGSVYSVGHSGDQGYGPVSGASQSHAFDALKPLRIDGFTVTGGSWSAGTDNITLTLMQGAATVAGPTAATMNTTGSTSITGLGWAVPQGTGYTIAVNGGTFYPIDQWTGTVSGQDGLIAVTDSDILQDWQVQEMNPCFSRTRVCSYAQDCECRDTTLRAAPTLCVDTTYNLNSLLYDTTYQDGQWVIVSGGGSLSQDSLLVVGANDDGTTTVRYDVYYGPDAPKADCPDSNVRVITINPLEVVDIVDGQGPFCMGDGTQTLTLSGGTVAGGTWSVLSTANATIDAATGVITPTDSGFVDVVYTTPGTCTNADTLQIQFMPVEDIDVITPDTSVCANSAAFTVRLSAGSATDGTWSGTGVTGSTFDPSGLAAGDYVVKYVKSGFSAACSDSDSVTVTIDPLDSALIATPLPSLCSTDPPAQLNLGSGATAGGNWTDSLAANTYINASGMFDPTGLTDGLYKVLYTTTGNCPASDSGYVTVTSNISYAIQGSQQTTYCLNYGLDTLDVDVAGGEIWTKSGNGVVSAAERIFNTNLMTPGTDTLWYGKAGSCGDTIAYEITINPIDTAEIDSINPVCQDTAAITMTITGSGTGGTWAGNGVAGDQFTAATAGVGVHMITYTTAGSCPIVDTTWIEVKERKDATITADTVAFCGASVAATMSSAQGGGTWSGWTGKWTTVNDSLIIFDPNANANTGIEMLYYTIVDDCGAVDSVSVSITAMEEAYVAAAGPFCADEAATTMAFDPAQGTTTPGGTWSGPGITDGATGAFDPATAGAGNHWIKYVTPGGCTDSDSVQVLVRPRMDATITTAPLIFCEGSTTPAAALATDMGGTWSGWTGAHTSATDNQVIFDPAVSGSGTGQLVYSIDESAAVCGDTDSVAVTVTAKDSALITGNLTFCQASTAENLTLSGGTTTGGVWSGTGITDAANGTFDPGVAGAGNHNIKYLTTGACPDSSEVQATVVASVDVVIDAAATDTILCSDQSDPTVVQTGTTGGTWSSTPTGLVNTGTGVIDIAAMAAAGAGTYEIKYEAGPGGNCYDADSINVRMIQVATPSITGVPTENLCVTLGSHQLTGNNGEATTWTVTSGAGSVDNTGLVSFTTSGDITVSYTHTGEGECPATPATATITVIDPANTTILDIADQCDNNGTTTINSQGGVTTDVRWWIEDDAGNTESTASNTSSIDFDAGWGAGTYTIYQEINNGCLDTGQIEVIVSAAPIVTMSADDSTLCEGVPVVITLNNSGATASSATWAYTHSNVLDTVTSTDLGTTTRSFDAEGLVTVTVVQSFTNGCTVTTVSEDGWLSVDTIPNAAFSFGPQPTTVLDPYITFTNESSVSDDLQWYFTPDTAREAVSVPMQGVNVSEYVEFLTENGDTFPVTLVATTPNGCRDTVTHDVIILNNVSIYVPNSFTPNADGLNDIFNPGGKYHDNPDGLEDYEFLIFNRWGEVIFTSTTPYMGWDGTYMNRVVQQDVYTWRISVYDPAVSKVVVQTGTVTLVR